MERKNTVFLTIIAVATLLVAVIGATFAYFSVVITGNESATSTIIKTANIKITYTAGTSVNLTDAIPGANGDVTFTVENTGDRTLTYKVKWTDVTNTFDQTGDHASELFYTVNVTTNGSNAVSALTATNAPTAAGYIALNSGNAITIAAGETHSYTIHVEFAETSSEQNYNQGKSFTAGIDVELAGDTTYSTDEVYSGV